jgi:succinate dehydrogenase / fumarate reductase cytochrome b subunit
MYKTTGFVSFFLRRVTGVALVLYIFAHIYIIGGAVSGPETFNERMALMTSPVFKYLEIALLAGVFWHGFDGLRLLLVNWFKITDKRKSLFATVFALTTLMVAAGGILILLELFHIGG